MHNIYFDGSCLNNGQPGAKAGWGFLVKNNIGDIVYEAQGSVPGRQTNNRGEIMGLLMSIKWLRTSGVDAKLYGDSKYVVDCFNGLSQRRANKDLWKEVIEAVDGVKSQIVSLEYIPREDNSEADELAKIGANSIL